MMNTSTPSIKRIKLTLNESTTVSPSNSPLQSQMSNPFTFLNLATPPSKSINLQNIPQTHLLSPISAYQLDQIPITERKARQAIETSMLPNTILTSNFSVQAVVGWGGNGVILTAQKFNSIKLIAIKIVYKTTRSGKRCFPLKSEFHQLPSELRILASLPHHPGILKFYEWFENDMYYYIVTDFVPIQEMPTKRLNLNAGLTLPMYSGSSDLFSYLDKHHAPTIGFIKNLFQHLAKTLLYLHSNGISHGDIKEENILISSHTSPILCDFGHSHTNDRLYSLYGTTDMTAPELLGNAKLPKEAQVKSGGYALDVWALGLTMFGCFGGKAPKNGVVDWISLKRLPKGCLSLLKGMLEVQPEKRFTMQQINAHPYLCT